MYVALLRALVAALCSVTGLCLVTGLHLATAQPADKAPQARLLAWVLGPGEVRAHTVELELETRVAVRTGIEEVVRRTSTVVSFLVQSLGLRRERADEMVVELAVREFRLGVLTKTGSSVVEVTMDDVGMTLRRDGEKPRRVPWANVPRGRGGEVGELIGQATSCTINRHANAITIDGRMKPWSQVLDSMDLTPVVVPLVPLPDTEVEPGLKWTVTGARTVELSRPWGTMKLGTRTEVTLVGFERHDGAEVARLAFVSTTAPVKEQTRLSYELTIKGEVLLGLDGAVVGGEAAVTVAASASVVDSHHELAGAGTIRFNAPKAGASPENTPD